MPFEKEPSTAGCEKMGLRTLLLAAFLITVALLFIGIGRLLGDPLFRICHFVFLFSSFALQRQYTISETENQAILRKNRTNVPYFFISALSRCKSRPFLRGKPPFFCEFLTRNTKNPTILKKTLFIGMCLCYNTVWPFLWHICKVVWKKKIL